MEREWPVTKLGEVVDINPETIVDDHWPYSHIRYIDITSVGEGVLKQPPQLVKITEAPSRAKRLVCEGDTIISTVRPGRRSVLFVSRAQPDWVVSTGFAVLRPRRDKIIPRYLYACVFDRKFTQYLVSREKGAAYPAVLPDDIAEAEIKLPLLPVQRAIAHVLGTLDDKIELLRRMNETLDAMARALFKSWFVDFDPVIDNALEAGNPIPDQLKEKAKHCLALGNKRKPLPKHIRRRFSDRFVASELGPIPAGWRVGTVDEIVSLSRESLNPRDFPNEVFDHYSVPSFDAGKIPVSEPGSTIKSNKLLVPCNAVLLSKLNPRFPRVWMPAVSSSRRSICSTEFLVALPRSGSSREFIFCLFTESSFLAKFSTLVTGTSGSHQRVKPNSFLAMQIIIPPNNVAELFTSSVRPSFEQLSRNLFQSRTLAALRDALLSKLISGELRVRDAKKSAGKAREPE